jgi:Protein of unknown function (DUF3301)
MMTTTTLVLLLLAMAGAGIWYSSLQARELANRVALETCQRLSVQFLDGTVAFSAMRPVRDGEGRLALRRSYVFDYTEDGMARLQGFVVLCGLEVESVGLAPDQHRFH